MTLLLSLFLFLNTFSFAGNELPQDTLVSPLYFNSVGLTLSQSEIVECLENLSVYPKNLNSGSCYFFQKIESDLLQKNRILETALKIQQPIRLKRTFGSCDVDDETRISYNSNEVRVYTTLVFNCDSHLSKTAAQKSLELYSTASINRRAGVFHRDSTLLKAVRVFQIRGELSWNSDRAVEECMKTLRIEKNRSSDFSLFCEINSFQMNNSDFSRLSDLYKNGEYIYSFTSVDPLVSPLFSKSLRVGLSVNERDSFLRIQFIYSQPPSKITTEMREALSASIKGLATQVTVSVTSLRSQALVKNEIPLDVYLRKYPARPEFCIKNMILSTFVDSEAVCNVPLINPSNDFIVFQPARAFKDTPYVKTNIEGVNATLHTYIARGKYSELHRTQYLPPRIYRLESLALEPNPNAAARFRQLVKMAYEEFKTLDFYIAK